jgi:hypothetical protein
MLNFLFDDNTTRIGPKTGDGQGRAFTSTGASVPIAPNGC